MEGKMVCTKCGTEMLFLGRESIQLGETTWFLGDLGNLLSGSLNVEIYRCPNCRKLDFYDWETNEQESKQDDMIVCPKCGASHGKYLTNCPECQHDYLTASKKWK